MTSSRNHDLLNALVGEFAVCVASQTDAINRGDSRAGNLLAKRYSAAFEGLVAHGDPGRDALAALLTHERADVRVMAAAYLLRHRHDEARAVLEAESSGTGLTAFGASQALKRWEEGTWALDP